MTSGTGSDDFVVLSAGDGTQVTEPGIEIVGRLPWSSNETFLCSIPEGSRAAAQEIRGGLGVYKPARGERTLWDFEPGTLCRREVAAFRLSELLGWEIVPRTVLIDGPRGVGSLQEFIDADFDEHYFTLLDRHARELETIAAFDIIANNADRKSGHCILGRDGRIYGIDHGTSFHREPKLRTVIWDFAGNRVPEAITAAVDAFVARFDAGNGPVAEAFAGLLDDEEIECIGSRAEALIADGTFPEPRSRHSFPWPMV